MYHILDIYLPIQKKVTQRKFHFTRKIRKHTAKTIGKPTINEIITARADLEKTNISVCGI